MGNNRLCILLWLPATIMVVLLWPLGQPYTYEEDVYAINTLYVSLGSPALPGWTANGGDPCMDNWQGVECVNSNITSITINAANLGGVLGNSLGNFTSIITINLSNNNIGGSIPDDLPITMQRFFLSSNQLTGSIPSSLSRLPFLTDISLNNNHLDGLLPDVFQSLSGLVNLDISSNNLSGQLPPSMGSLSSLITLHMQDNQLSGILNPLEDLPLENLNIENNLFSGPIPVKLFNIPNFKKDGNPFNTSIAPSALPPSLPPSSPVPGAPLPSGTHASFSNGPTAQKNSPSRKTNLSTIKIIAYVVAAVVSLIVMVLMVIFCLSKYQERKSRDSEHTKSQVGRVHRRPEEPKGRGPLVKPNVEIKSAALEMASEELKQHAIDVLGTDVLAIPLPPPPPPPSRPPHAEKITVNPIVYPQNMSDPLIGKINRSSSAGSFSVASLQQFTNSFAKENLIRESRLVKVYLAELPDGKLLEVMKIDDVNERIAVDEFLELVLNISELRHPNVLELVGYCAELGQQLLVYNYFSRKTLHDLLHLEDDLESKLSWNARLRIALGAAKALEYLHEGCQPSVVHQNFEPANVLLNNKLAVRVSECGLASMMSSNMVTQLSGCTRALFTYEAPELHESGPFTDRCDVYSFGVVLLELLTGRKPYDSSRPHAEQHLMRWASSQLHDIDAISRMVDPSIQGKCSKKSLSRFADIISRCVQQGPEFRPAMSEIVQDLDRIVSDTREAPS